jgi:hypothetical protein
MVSIEFPDSVEVVKLTEALASIGLHLHQNKGQLIAVQSSKGVTAPVPCKDCGAVGTVMLRGGVYCAKHALERVW